MWYEYSPNLPQQRVEVLGMGLESRKIRTRCAESTLFRFNQQHQLAHVCTPTRRAIYNLSPCFPRILTVLACGPFCPISSVNVTRVPGAIRSKASSHTLLRWK